MERQHVDYVIYYSNYMGKFMFLTYHLAGTSRNLTWTLQKKQQNNNYKKQLNLEHMKKCILNGNLSLKPRF